MTPSWRSVPANSAVTPPLVMMRPRLSTWSSGAWTRKRTCSKSMLSITMSRPAASTTEPSSACRMPVLVTSGATSTISPPGRTRMKPWLVTLPPSPEKANRPATKSASAISSDEATMPAVSISACLPKTMPLRLIRNTRPLDNRLPRMSEGMLPVTRLSTAEAPCCCTKRVSSPREMEKSCQWMMAPGELVMDNSPGLGLAKVAWPWVTCAPVGLAPAGAASTPDTATANTDLARGKSAPASPWALSRRLLITLPPKPLPTCRCTGQHGHRVHYSNSHMGLPLSPTPSTSKNSNSLQSRLIRLRYSSCRMNLGIPLMQVRSSSSA